MIVWADLDQQQQDQQQRRQASYGVTRIPAPRTQPGAEGVGAGVPPTQVGGARAAEPRRLT